jgi:Nucleoside diphosphate kinase
MTAVSKPADWRQLVTPDKQKLFAQDLYLRECWADAVDIASDATAQIGSLALLTFKPEAVPARRMRPTLDFLIAHELIPVAVSRVRYTRHSMRELWRYDWDDYTTDRLALATVMYTAGETLLLILRDAAGNGLPPAATRLRQLRGPAAAADRKPGDLRELLHPPSEVLNFVHVADGPVEVIREIGIFLDRHQRRALLAGAFVGAGSQMDLRAETRAEIARLEATCAPHDLDFASSMQRVTRADPAGSVQLRRLRTAAQRGETLGWDELCAAIDPADERIDVWDFLVIACHVIELWR